MGPGEHRALEVSAIDKWGLHTSRGPDQETSRVHQGERAWHTRAEDPRATCGRKPFLGANPKHRGYRAFLSLSLLVEVVWTRGGLI
ncbi:hypothetical protein NDU88_009846 [Pleurodeles waltl]|uniref:Uncharacterized protein n=1 Tax=Pleurodeles waltl TaxID=8319 RepID=A0AAV7QYI2_PLEWA|nr:hypothetical protein NDU88_009846 [Pleurodeles waltl]